jgi:hypothetical protein
MRHPEPDGPSDRTPIEVGAVWENPATRERATILEILWENQAGRATAEPTALVGARVVGKHRHQPPWSSASLLSRVSSK